MRRGRVLLSISRLEETRREKLQKRETERDRERNRNRNRETETERQMSGRGERGRRKGYRAEGLEGDDDVEDEVREAEREPGQATRALRAGHAAASAFAGS
eukprot:3282963-Rhodomonas_salina.1